MVCLVGGRGRGYHNGMICHGGVPQWYDLSYGGGGYHNVTICLVGEGVTTMV